MSIPTQIGVNGQGSPIYRFDAIPTTANSGPWLNAADYAQANDGGDFALAFNRAASALATTGGGVIVLPPYPVTIQSGMLLSADNIEVRGSGWNSQIVAGANLTGYMLTVQAPGGGAFRYGIRIADVFFNANHVAGVGGLDLQTTYHAVLSHVRVRYCPGTAIYMDGSSGNTGAYNVIEHCTITDGGAGIGIATNFSEWLTVIGGTISFYNQAGGVGIKSANLNCRYLGVGIDNNDTGIQLEFAGRNTIAGCQFDRGQTRFVYMHGTQYASITGNSFNSYNGTAGTGCLDVTDGNNAGNIVTGNTVRGGSGWTNFVYEHGTVGAPGNTYANNDTGGSALVLVNGTSRGNRGYNPVGKTTVQPAVPASGTAYTNVLGVDCTVYLTGGTFTGNHQIGGQSIGNSTATVLRVAAGQSVTLTYSAAPTWLWIGD